MRAAALLVSSWFLVGLAGCERKSAPQPASESAAPASAAAPAAAPAGDRILLGEVGSLTGAEATFGISTRNGIELALREVNAQGGVRGKKVDVRVYDDQGKPEEAASAVTRLIAEDRVRLVLGEVASTNSLAMAPKAQAAGVPMITPSSTNPKVTAVGDFIFRVCFIDPFQGEVMARFVREHLKLGKVAVLTDQKSDYSLGLSEVFRAKAAAMGAELVATESYSKGDTDFRAQLTAIKRAAPEAVYVPGYYTDVGLIARQAREIGLKATLLGGDGWESEKLFELGGSAVDGSYYTNHYSPEDPSPRVQGFLTAYKTAYGAVPDSLAALGYDAAKVAVDALSRAKDESGAALRDAIAATRDFPGVAGTISLDANRNAVKPAVVLKVAGGKTEYVATVAPAP
ncbi:MAG: ABC transporter substrate-binding protein [Deltaproteobacteria bacterium]|nr:ABC transporter substrate-binding protein [Deltaproteobacteria bacterium]